MTSVSVPISTDNYELIKTRSDGHCIISCFAKKFNEDTRNIFRKLSEEFVENGELYASFSDELTIDEVLVELQQYEENKKYSLQTVDLVLEALSRIFSCQIVIYIKSDEGTTYSIIGDMYEDSSIHLLRSGEHFDLLHLTPSNADFNMHDTNTSNEGTDFDFNYQKPTAEQLFELILFRNKEYEKSFPLKGSGETLSTQLKIFDWTL